ncbi:MAG TPA: CbiX/SirB N-terminal domain-containing protein, partial [Leptolyngbyaceae cyanobacterium]
MSLSPSTAYLLVSHGSRDPRHQTAMNRLAQLVRDRLQQVCPTTAQLGTSVEPRISEIYGMNAGSPGAIAPSTQKPLPSPLRPATLASPAKVEREISQPYPIVGTAYLELAPLPLHEQIYEFCRRIRGAGIERVQVVPVFLLQGVHVMEDIPAEIALAQQKLEPISLQIDLCRHLGSHAGLGCLLQAKMAAAASESRLLLAHGSRRPSGNRPVEALAELLGATPAFWSTPGHLEDQVVTLMQMGCQRLTILPYFLFTAGIT